MEHLRESAEKTTFSLVKTYLIHLIIPRVFNTSYIILNEAKVEHTLLVVVISKYFFYIIMSFSASEV